MVLHFLKNNIENYTIEQPEDNREVKTQMLVYRESRGGMELRYGES